MCWLDPVPALAWPVYAQRSGQPCATCHAPGFTGLTATGEAFRQGGFHWPPFGMPVSRVIILGYSVLIWTGAAAALFCTVAVCTAFLAVKSKKVAQGHWHNRTALAAVLFTLVHVVLAVLQVFFAVVI